MNFLLFLAAVSVFFYFNNIKLKCTYRRQVASFSRVILLLGMWFFFFQILLNLLKQINELVLGHFKILITFNFVIS